MIHSMCYSNSSMVSFFLIFGNRFIHDLAYIEKEDAYVIGKCNECSMDTCISISFNEDVRRGAEGLSFLVRLGPQQTER